jgi:glycosyltransferase involved in cell wall biosynthesis
MAVYNGEPWLQVALDSVLTQGVDDLEFVIVDDCSTDGTAAMIARAHDARIVYVRNDRNLGQTASLNKALQLARAPLIARIDADDAWLPGKLAKQLAHLAAHPDVAVLGTRATRIDREGIPRGPNDPPLSADAVRAKLLRGVPVVHVSVVMRREAVLAVGGYPEQYRFAADYALWSVLSRAGAVIANIPDRLTLYREDPATFGALQKIGAAGDESAEIIQLNARALAGVELPIDDCRDIALLAFPHERASARRSVRAYRHLVRLQRIVAPRTPLRDYAALVATLGWSLGKRWRANRDAAHGFMAEFLGVVFANLVRPDVVAAAIAGVSIASLGPRRIGLLRARVAPFFANRGG